MPSAAADDGTLKKLRLAKLEKVANEMRDAAATMEHQLLQFVQSPMTNPALFGRLIAVKSALNEEVDAVGRLIAVKRSLQNDFAEDTANTLNDAKANLLAATNYFAVLWKKMEEADVEGS